MRIGQSRLILSASQQQTGIIVQLGLPTICEEGPSDIAEQQGGGQVRPGHDGDGLWLEAGMEPRTEDMTSKKKSLHSKYKQSGKNRSKKQVQAP